MNRLDLKPKSQNRTALLLVGHGVRGPCAPAAISPHKDLIYRLRETGQFDEIRWGYLTCAPYVEDVIASFDTETVYILPMLMCDGYFSRNSIPERLALAGIVSQRDNGQKIVQCLPVGLSKMMSDIMVSHMLNYCEENKLKPSDASVVIIGHGSSKDDASRMAVSMQAEHINHLNKFKEIHPAYLEEAPNLPTVLKDMKGPVLVMGYFANCGTHSTNDVTLLMRESDADAVYLGPVGTLPDVMDVVIDCVHGG